ncbi:ABC transporter permease [Sulfolobus sp. A20-N-F6]|uniref:ABC transporter permease n=1 Tax=Saccharolobus sp. A20 TaxID=1891280 RepID=UPI000845EDB9|nr:ABC transporter permease [Sulfolobus sp. A20]TRM74250.1 ABC transporter permease [Sulfolobus sp. B5]TRM76836.1 ABC transporter permease [Sulfolobus sp. E5]TRM77244.1 ABC transporter permease [Sulfolobus sp. A20-N-F8]TRM82898.1 ABC transporter permease [Sulfolobus sp. F3]TRM84266.1 ABC transporter permease [Sulfolobus sp. A20-N-F6]TRN02723.1 ABC transporter permease [Sulfolobus sp. F1]TRN04736.1 ABC transporter permease [Sulfolobus sp. E1]
MRVLKSKFLFAFTIFYGYSSIKRGFIYVLTYLSIPLAELFLIYIITHGTFVKFAIIGGLISVMANNGFSSIGDFVFLRLESRLQDLLVATQIGPSDYIIGLMLANLLYTLPGIALYVILSIVYKVINLMNFFPLLVTMILLLFTTSSIGFFLASLVPHTRYGWGLAGLLSSILTIVPPVFYPYTFLPKNVYLALLPIPTTASAIFAQGITGLINVNQNMLYISFIILFIEAIIFLSLSVRFSRWREI